MRLHKFLKLVSGFALLLMIVVSVAAQDRNTGAIKGKVRVETGSPAGVSILVRQGDREITRATTDRNGDFSIQRLTPGNYGLTFRKAGLGVSAIENFEIKAGKTRTLDRILLPIDEGSIAFLRGSIFDSGGRSLPNARVELARILDDGSLKKIDGRITNETGSFVFRLTPQPAKYRVTVKADHMEPASQDVEVDGAVVYRIAISLQPTR
jgi:hypothetical protein